MWIVEPRGVNSVRLMNRQLRSRVSTLVLLGAKDPEVYRIEKGRTMRLEVLNQPRLPLRPRFLFFCAKSRSGANRQSVEDILACLAIPHVDSDGLALNIPKPVLDQALQLFRIHAASHRNFLRAGTQSSAYPVPTDETGMSRERISSLSI